MEHLWAMKGFNLIEIKNSIEIKGFGIKTIANLTFFIFIFKHIFN